MGSIGSDYRQQQPGPAGYINQANAAPGLQARPLVTGDNWYNRNVQPVASSDAAQGLFKGIGRGLQLFAANRPGQSQALQMQFNREDQDTQQSALDRALREQEDARQRDLSVYLQGQGLASADARTDKVQEGANQRNQANIDAGRESDLRKQQNAIELEELRDQKRRGLLDLKGYQRMQELEAEDALKRGIIDYETEKRKPMTDAKVKSLEAGTAMKNSTTRLNDSLKYGTDSKGQVVPMLRDAPVAAPGQQPATGTKQRGVMDWNLVAPMNPLDKLNPR